MYRFIVRTGKIKSFSTRALSFALCLSSGCPVGRAMSRHGIPWDVLRCTMEHSVARRGIWGPTICRDNYHGNPQNFPRHVVGHSTRCRGKPWHLPRVELDQNSWKFHGICHGNCHGNTNTRRGRCNGNSARRISKCCSPVPNVSPLRTTLHRAIPISLHTRMFWSLLDPSSLSHMIASAALLPAGPALQQCGECHILRQGACFFLVCSFFLHLVARHPLRYAIFPMLVITSSPGRKQSS